MSQSLEFGYGSSVGNDSVFGAPRSWVRTKNGTGMEATYRRGRPRQPNCFFSVLWQVNVRKEGQANKPEFAHTVRLQVESPRHDENPPLNELKRKLIKALVTSELLRLVRQNGYRYDNSRVRTSDAQIQSSITITLFKVLLNDSRVKSTPEETINAIHDALGPSVDAVLRQFDADLEQCFIAKVEARPKQVTVIRRKAENAVWPIADMSVEHVSKRTRYEALIKARKACRACNGVTNPSAIRGGIFDCDEIGAWSLWQGNLNAQVMVVGQDWGDVDWFLRVKGRPTDTSKTNTTLVELLRSAGLEINLANKTIGKGLFFFTNAVLCMKAGGAQAPVKNEWLRNCGTRFLRPTIDLVQPEVVVCLGAKAYSALLTAYDITPRQFGTAVGSNEPDRLPGGVSVFAVYHCGAYVLNTHRKLQAQIQDWKRIGNFLRQNRTK